MPTQLLGQAINTAGSIAGANRQEKELYAVNPTNWYKSLPYGFEFFNRSEKSTSTSVFYLPILPSNINITTHFATNIVTTLYGIVEEHSEIRYYDITISGTTGIAPRWPNEIKQGTKPEDLTSEGRLSFESTGVDLGGFLPEVTNTLNTVLDAADDIANSISGNPPMSTGVIASKSGYAAFHNLYKFLHKYKADAAGISHLGNSPRSIHPISFLNYKDGVRYDVAIQQFNLTRSADNPMLYNYSIKMRAFNLRGVDQKIAGGDSSDLKSRLSTLGLGDVTGGSPFTRITGAVSSATTLISGLL